MRMETENAVRSIVMIDPEITKDMVERAIVILRGQIQSEEDLIHVMKRMGSAFWAKLDEWNAMRSTL